mgnify:CR=1 FL=1
MEALKRGQRGTSLFPNPSQFHSAIASTVGRKIDAFPLLLLSSSKPSLLARRAPFRDTEGSLGDRLRHRGTSDEKAYLINDAEQPAAEGHQVVGKQGYLDEALSLSLKLLSSMRYSPITTGYALPRRAWQASASIIKAVVGAGSFALPWAFLQAGLFGAPLSPSVCPPGGEWMKMKLTIDRVLGIVCGGVRVRWYVRARVGGIIGILVLAILSCYTIRMLIQCKRELVGTCLNGSPHSPV